MAKDFGSKAHMAWKGIDPVARNSIWREHCQKELATVVREARFQIPNPKKMYIFAEKPNLHKAEWNVSKEDFEKATAILRKLGALKDTHLLPNEKLPVPETSSQEYGWNPKPLLPPSKIFMYPRNACFETRYADKYYFMTKTTPYSRNIKPPQNAG